MARTDNMTEPEFTDDQIQRIDNLQAAAIDFFNVLMEADDYGFLLEDVWDLIYAGADMLVKRGHRIRIPTQVTEKDGTERIIDWYEGDEPDADLEH